MLNFLIKYIINLSAILCTAWILWLVGLEFKTAVLVATVLMVSIPVSAPVFIYTFQTVDKPQEKPPGLMN